MTVFCVLSKHRGFNKHIWQAFHSWRAQDDTVCKQYARAGGKQVYWIIQLIDYSQDTCYPTMKNGARTPRIRVGPRISSSRQYGIYRPWGSGQKHENVPTNHPNTHTHTHTHTRSCSNTCAHAHTCTDTHALVTVPLRRGTQTPRIKYYKGLKNSLNNLVYFSSKFGAWGCGEVWCKKEQVYEQLYILFS